MSTLYPPAAVQKVFREFVERKGGTLSAHDSGHHRNEFYGLYWRHSAARWCISECLWPLPLWCVASITIPEASRMN